MDKDFTLVNPYEKGQEIAGGLYSCEEIAARVEKTPSFKETGIFKGHLKNCPECREKYKEK